MIGSRSQLFVLATATTLAVSQSLSGLGLSQQCQDTLTNSLANPELSRCLNVFEAFNIFDSNSGSSIIAPVDTWLEGICGTSSCSNDTLSQAAQNITMGCQSDLSSIGISADEAQIIAGDVLAFYPTIRKIACLADKSSSANTLCVTEVLTDFQNADGTLSINNIVSTAQSIINGTSSGISLPKNVTCNDCTQAAWAIIQQDIPQVASDSIVTNAVSNQCGADFLNGTQSSDIFESSGTPSPGAALGGHITFNSFIGLALVPMVSAFAGTALLL